MCTYMHMYTQAHSCLYLHTDIPIYTHAYTLTQTHRHRHIFHAESHVSPPWRRSSMGKQSSLFNEHGWHRCPTPRLTLRCFVHNKPSFKLPECPVQYQLLWKPPPWCGCAHLVYLFSLYTALHGRAPWPPNCQSLQGYSLSQSTNVCEVSSRYIALSG